MFLRSADHVTSEVSYVPTDDFQRHASHDQSALKRTRVRVEHYQDQLLIRSNQRHANFDLFTAPLTANSQASGNLSWRATTTII